MTLDNNEETVKNSPQENHFLTALTHLEDIASSIVDENTNHDLIKQYTFLEHLTYYGGSFVLAAFSGVLYWYDAGEAAERYEYLIPSQAWIFDDYLPFASYETNLIFNWVSYLALWSDTRNPISTLCDFFYTYSEHWQRKSIGIFAGLSTLIPYFFIGYNGSTIKQYLMIQSAILNFPVFYLGALDFYAYYNASFIQVFLALLTCSSDHYYSAIKKFLVVNQLKNVITRFSCSNKEKRMLLINNFKSCSSDYAKLSFLFKQGNDGVVFSQKQAWASFVYSYFHLVLFSGLGIPGLLVILQNYGHIVETAIAVFSFSWNTYLSWTLVFILCFGNLIASLGYSFSGMANFDFIDLVKKMFFLDVSQAQQVLTGESDKTQHLLLYLFKFSLFFALFINLRVLYVFSGFVNDELNYDAAISCGIPEEYATIIGFQAGMSGAIIFNGVQCEKLYRKVMEEIVLSSHASNEDKLQVKFEQGLRDLVESIEFASIDDFKQSLVEPKICSAFSSFFKEQSSEDLNATDEERKQLLPHGNLAKA